MGGRHTTLVLLCALSWGVRPCEAQLLTDLVATVDGTHDAHVSAESGRITVRSELVGRVLRIAVTSPPLAVASLCVAHDSVVTVLHASMALGERRFEASVDGDTWRGTDRFAWSLRGGAVTREAIARRGAYLAEHGWVASTVDMGTPGETEFLIDTSMLAVSAFAFGLMLGDQEGTVFGWPLDAPSGCGLRALVAGSSDDFGPSFRPTRWVRSPSVLGNGG